MNHSKAIILVSFILAVVAGCKDKNNNQVDDNFEKQAMLENIGNNVIAPRYVMLVNELNALKDASLAFEQDNSASNFTALQSSFSEAYGAWQYCSPYEFGPAADENLRLSLNTYPADTSQVETLIEAGSIDFGQAQNADAKGFPAIDYVLFYASSAGELTSERIDFVLLNVDYMLEKASAVSSAWAGDYFDEFTMNLGSDAGSSISQLVNEINYDFELVKNAKIGIPSGTRTLGVAQPEMVEALYSGRSLEYVTMNLEAIEEAYSGGTGLGLDDYLDDLGAQYNGVPLSSSILAGFNEIDAATSAVSGSLFDAISNDPEGVEAIYSAMQNQVVLLKTDLPSQLGIQITYQDNDGD